MDARQERRRRGFKARDFGAQSHAKRLDALFVRQARDRAATRAALRAASEARDARAQTRAPVRAPPVALPEWLVDVPGDLHEAWYAVPRPDGKRVFVVAAAGRTVVRARDGRRLCVGAGGGFAVSGLHGGRPGSRGLTVLDCVMPVEHARRGGMVGSWLWVLDVMVWNDRYMHDCAAEFRFFWMRNALLELDDNDVDACFSEDAMGDEEGCGEASSTDGRSWLNFRPVPLYEADEAGLSAAADLGTSASCGLHRQDGILLYAKDASVELGLTPAVLAWKDAGTSPHFIETFPEPAPPDVPPSDLPLVATLSRVKTQDGRHVLQTSDGPPVLIAEVPYESLVVFGKSWQSRLFRVRILNTANVAANEAPEIELLELAGHGRSVADSWSRILFQCKARHCPTTLNNLKTGRPIESEESLT